MTLNSGNTKIHVYFFIIKIMIISTVDKNFRPAFKDAVGQRAAAAFEKMENSQKTWETFVLPNNFLVVQVLEVASHNHDIRLNSVDYNPILDHRHLHHTAYKLRLVSKKSEDVLRYRYFS